MAGEKDPSRQDLSTFRCKYRMMFPRTLVFSWPYALIFWVVFLWAFVPEMRYSAKNNKPSLTPQDALSKQILQNVQALAMLAAFTIAANVHATALPYAPILFWVGLAVLVAGSLFRRHCWRILGASFTAAVIVKPDQAVVERGAYRYIRHPSYTAAALIFLGIGLALANWLSIVVLFLGVAIGYGYRVRVEERALVTVIGDPYRDYMRRTKRFIPYLF